MGDICGPTGAVASREGHQDNLSVYFVCLHDYGMVHVACGYYAGERLENSGPRRSTRKNEPRKSQWSVPCGTMKLRARCALQCFRLGRQGVGQAALSQGVEQAGQAVEAREVEPARVLQQRGVQGVGAARDVDELARVQLALP